MVVGFRGVRVVSQPRAPKDREAVVVAAAVLRSSGFVEVADMLEDIAAGKWTLTNAVCVECGAGGAEEASRMCHACLHGPVPS